MLRSSPPDHRMRAALGAAILLALIGNSTPVAAAVRYVKIVNVAPGHVLWLHSGPGRHFQRIGFLPYSARQIRAYRCKALVTGSWCQVRHRGTRGWASKRFLTKDSARFVKALAPDQRDSGANSLEEQTSELLSSAGWRRACSAGYLARPHCQNGNKFSETLPRKSESGVENRTAFVELRWSHRLAGMLAIYRARRSGLKHTAYST